MEYTAMGIVDHRPQHRSLIVWHFFKIHFFVQRRSPAQDRHTQLVFGISDVRSLLKHGDIVERGISSWSFEISIPDRRYPGKPLGHENR